MTVLHALHLLIFAMYTAAPIVALAAALRAKRLAQTGAFIKLVTTAVAGFFIGLGLCIVYAVASGGRIMPTQILLAA